MSQVLNLSDKVRFLNEADWLKALAFADSRPYFAMYSTLWQGIVTDPKHMLLPLDEHMVHRGDGVFEAIRVTGQKPFLLTPHLERLQRSAEALALKLPLSLVEIEDICRELARLVTTPEGILRLFISRGPGDFSVNPYTTTGSQFYAIAMPFQPLPREKYEKGVTLMLSQVPFKPYPYTGIKSCNYLYNVMMKKECVDAGFDFCVGLNADGKIAEGATENILILDREGRLRAPKFDYTLQGTTLIRVMKLAESLRSEVQDIALTDLTLDDLTSAKEVMMVGTTLGVLPVASFQGQPIGAGRPGPVAQKLYDLFLADLKS